VISLSLIIDVKFLCPKEQNIFITWKMIEIEDRNIKN
jgi:hypothetical protein